MRAQKLREPRAPRFFDREVGIVAFERDDPQVRIGEVRIGRRLRHDANHTGTFVRCKGRLELLGRNPLAYGAAQLGGEERDRPALRERGVKDRPVIAHAA